MRPPAPPPITFLPAQAAGMGHAAGPSLTRRWTRRQQRNWNRSRNRNRRRVVGEGDADEAAASRDPSVKPAPAPDTSLPASSSAATSAVPVSHVPAASAAQIPAAAAEESDCQIDDRVGSMPPTERDARVGRGEQSKSAEELKAVLHATTNSPSTLSSQIAATPLLRIPAAHKATAAHHITLSRTTAVPHATASQAVHCPMPPPRQLPERAAASGCSYPPPRPERPAAVTISQVPAAQRMPPPRLPRPFLFSPSYACPPRSVPPPPLRQRAPPTSPPCPMPPPPRPPTTPRLQGSSPSAPLPAVAAASLLRPTLCEISQRPAPAPAEENVGAVGPADADRVRSVQPREREESKSAEELKDARMAIEAHVKSVPPTDATVGRQEESKTAEELKSELERVSKQMNDLKNECAELKRDMKNKDLEIEAKEAEIQNFKRAKVACSSKDISSTRMDIDQPFHNPTNEALHAEGSYWTSTSRDEKLNGVMKELHSMETQQAPGNTQVILNQNNPGQVSADSAAQSGHAGDWKEEIYQMIRSLKDQHFAKLNELFNNISLKVQPVDSITAHQMLSKKFSGMENFKRMLDRILQFLQTSKSTIEPSMRYKVLKYENHIINIFSLERKMQQRVQQQFLQEQVPQEYKQILRLPSTSETLPPPTRMSTPPMSLARRMPTPPMSPARRMSTPPTSPARRMPTPPMSPVRRMPTPPTSPARRMPTAPLLPSSPAYTPPPPPQPLPTSLAQRMPMPALLPPTSASPSPPAPPPPPPSPVLLSSTMSPLRRMPPLPFLTPVSHIPGDKGARSEKARFMLLGKVVTSAASLTRPPHPVIWCTYSVL